MTYHFLVKGRFPPWIALTFIISVHILHLSPHSSRTQYLGWAKLLSTPWRWLFWATYWRAPPCTHQQPTNVVWGRRIFSSLPMSSLELLQSNHDHYVFICHLVHWDQIQLGYSYYRSLCQFQAQFIAIMAHHNRTGLRLTSTKWVSTKVSSTMRCTTSISHIMKFPQIPMSHIRRSHATLPHLYHAAHHF
jgi:hypothetical protein